MLPRLRSFLVAFGLVLVLGAGLTFAPQAAPAQSDCDNANCIKVCVGGDCATGCSDAEEWDCAGDEDSRITSVMCPIDPE
jgi:hypothetical protein